MAENQFPEAVMPPVHDCFFDDMLAPLYRFPVSRIQVFFTSEKTFRMAGAEPTVRSRLGFHLRRICCAFPDDKKRKCSHCSLMDSCFYIRLFSPVAKSREGVPNSGIRSFVFSLQGSRVLKPGERGSVIFSLFGSDIHYRFFMEAVSSALQSMQLVISNIEPLLPKNAPSDDLGHPLELWLPTPGNEPKEVMLFFQTPVRFVKSGRKVKEDAGFMMIIQAVIRRLRDLKRAYGVDQDMGKTDDYFFAQVKEVHPSENNLIWTRRKRHSYSQEQDVFLDGFTGNIFFDPPAGRFYRLLKAAELVHIGKGTSNGNGKIRVMMGED